MTVGPAHALAALLLEDADFRPAGFAFDDRHDTGVGDERGTGENLAAVLFDDQHLVDDHFRARRRSLASQRREATGSHLDLLTARLNDCVHNRHLSKGDSLPSKWLRSKDLSSAAGRKPRGYSAFAASSTAAAWPSTLTLSHRFATLPSAPIR